VQPVAAQSEPAARPPNKPIQESIDRLPLRAPLRKKKPSRTAKEAMAEKARARAGSAARAKQSKPPRAADAARQELSDDLEHENEHEHEQDRDSDSDLGARIPGVRPPIWRRLWNWVIGK
jgi:hypothetical protein